MGSAPRGTLPPNNTTMHKHVPFTFVGANATASPHKQLRFLPRKRCKDTQYLRLVKP